jgi:hypothetical protein
MKNKTQRGGAPFRLSEKVDQTMEEALRVFIPASTKKLISHGENGVVVSCTASAARLMDLFVDLEAEKSAVLVLKITPIFAKPVDREKQKIYVADKKQGTTIHNLYLHSKEEFEREAEMQRAIYLRSLTDLRYAICPMLAFSAVLKPDDSMFQGWLTFQDQNCNVGIHVMELLTAPKTLNAVMKEGYGHSSMEYIQYHIEDGAEAPFKACSRLAFDLNSIGFAHNDLHGSNFLTSQGRWYMVDFGFTKRLTNAQLARFDLLVARGELANAVEGIELKKNKDMPYIGYDLGERPHFSRLRLLLSLKYAPKVDGTHVLNAQYDDEIAQLRSEERRKRESDRKKESEERKRESDRKRESEDRQRATQVSAPQGWATSMVASLWQRAKRTFSRRH